MPLMWAHGDYIKLLRSMADGKVFDLIPEVQNRYSGKRARNRIELWKFNCQPKSVQPDSRLRVQAEAPFRLHWTRDEWHTINDTASTMTPLGLTHADIQIGIDESSPLRFTFYWPEADKWEGRDYFIEVKA
jgi:glucoamylase